MRIAVVSDIHGNLLALHEVIADIGRRNVDVVVNLGDSLSGPLQPAETAEYLMSQPSWVQLAGNHERQLLDFVPDKRGPSDRYAHAQLGPEVFKWMASLEPAQALDDSVFLCHGTPRSDLEYFLETIIGPNIRQATIDEVGARLGATNADVVLCGHTHVPRIMTARCGTLIVNPGSLGLPAYEDDHPVYHLIENGAPEARYAIVEKRAGAWSADLLSVSYDHVAEAKVALERGRLDWAFALEHGRMPSGA
jgi:putative phosphoesterase